MPTFPFYKQAEAKDCGPTCLRIIAKHYGKTINVDSLRRYSETNRAGSSLLGLSEAAQQIGFRSIGVKQNFNVFKKEVPFPCIAHWNNGHFIVIYKIKKDKVYVSDPAYGLLTYTTAEFIQRWIGNNATEETREGIALLVEPSPQFYNDELDENANHFGFSFISRYLFRYKAFIVQLAIGMTAASLLQLIIPFVTQSIVDIGIQNQDIHFVFLMLFAQVALFLGRTSIEVIRSWILLHLSTRINISLISDFFVKLTNLPISFFDVRMTGDILQRINDHKRIEQILTTSSLSVFFSMFNLLIMGGVLAWYNLQIFMIFILGSFLYFSWILLFLKKRRDLDYKRFSEGSSEQSKVIELINGMQEIKLHNAERQKRWGWEFVQARLYKVAIKNLRLEQMQSVGSSFINEFKNILITVLSATLVISNDITLGMMMAITYMVGQLNAPVSQLIEFVREIQDAKIALERLGEIHNKEDETQTDASKIQEIPKNAGFRLNNLSFSYVGSYENIIKNLNLHIPPNKTTAIVGTSGSGKTTLMKLLLKFYEANEGVMQIGSHDVKNIAQKAWRNQCGVVMQEAYIFNDSIANNIAVGVDIVDRQRLNHAIQVANIGEYIDSLPSSINTSIGSEGIGLSTGQKQRLLIARAVYKNPQFLFFDEATSALDANNEKIIMENLDRFFENRTVVVIAHRLSTVKNAHQIVVLEKGKIEEIGNHKTLVQKKGSYYNLVKNQLELGS